jgi:hypothetical protein
MVNIKEAMSGSFKAPKSPTSRLASRDIIMVVSCLSHLGCRAQTSGYAQGVAEALPGLLKRLGCSGFGVQLPRQALAPGLRQHFALPLAGEFPADVGVHEHGLPPGYLDVGL